MQDKQLIDKKIVAKHFDRAAVSYDKAAILQRTVGMQMLARLDLVHIDAKVILDVGAGTGYFTHLLEKKYPDARVIALDMACGMLQQAKQYKKWWRAQSLICADMEVLPFADDSVDLIFANLSMQWSTNLTQLLQEWQRVLKPQGLLMFTSLGVDSLKELRISWAKVDDIAHVHNFIDMHDIGDALVNANFLDPVLDTDYYTLTYNHLMQLLHDLKAVGVQNAHPLRRKSLSSKNHFKQLQHVYESWRDNEGLLPLSYEVVFGHAWASTTPLGIEADASGMVNISLPQLRQMLKRNEKK